jgi:hypothetical protein
MGLKTKNCVLRKRLEYPEIEACRCQLLSTIQAEQYFDRRQGFGLP